jgi:hypothetical protein
MNFKFKMRFIILSLFSPIFPLNGVAAFSPVSLLPRGGNILPLLALKKLRHVFPLGKQRKEEIRGNTVG